MSAFLQLIDKPLFTEKGITVKMLRLDALRPLVNGNKLFKLKYNLQYAIDNKYEGILTFGGQYSNHIHATAAAAQEQNLKSIGIVVGDENNLTPTLLFARNMGMQLVFVNRAEYRQKHLPEYIAQLQQQYPTYFVIPEGGSNLLAVKGCEEIPALIKDDFDCIITACGTGGTLAGIAKGLPQGKQAIGISVLKGDDELTPFIQQLHGDVTLYNWRVVTGYHFGGYAKQPKEVADYIDLFYLQHNIQLEHVYTAKMMLAIEEMARKNIFERGTKIIAAHTGGLQR